MDLGLKNKIAVVTGGSSGIGLATVETFLQEGVKVAFCGRDKNKLDRAEQGFSKKYSMDNIFSAVCDVLDATAVSDFAKQVGERFGGVDILVNNAGGGRVSTFANTSDEAWLAELTLKFNSVIYPVRNFLPYLQRSEFSSVVVVNSLLALQPEPHMVATSAARAGLLNLVRSMATEFAPNGIRVNSILLGTIESGQWQRRYQENAEEGQSYEQWLIGLARQKKILLGRFGRPEEAAKAIVFLASPLSSYTTGSSIDVSGGIARFI